MRGRKLRCLAEGSTEQLRAAFRIVRTKEQFRHLLCLWLRAALHLRSEQIALALDMAPGTVRRVQARFPREGVEMFKKPAKGGRRRQNLTVAAERAFLDRLLKETQPANAILDARFVQEQYERMMGRAVTGSVVYRVLRRHGWRRVMMGAISTPRAWAAAKLPDPRPYRGH